MAWGDGSAVPTSGVNLVVLGTETNGVLHFRIFDAAGAVVVAMVAIERPPSIWMP